MHPPKNKKALMLFQIYVLLFSHACIIKVDISEQFIVTRHCQARTKKNAVKE